MADWLQPNAKLDPLDDYDAGADLIHGHEISYSRRRMLLVRDEE